jgi:hypothetical protein
MTSGGPNTATAFWSYARSDDDGADGQIRRLKEQLDRAYKRHSGDDLESFFDRQGEHRIEWGDEWWGKISQTIARTMFFIAVISPSYLKSDICRREFMEFWEKASASAERELLLPILWVKVYPQSDDEHKIWNIAKERHYVDWTRIRRLLENDAQYTGLIDEMGERLAQASRGVDDRRELLAPPAGTPDDESKDAEPPEPEEPPGLLDLHADAMSSTESFVAHLNAAFAAQREMEQEVRVVPLNPGMTPGQRLFESKRVANEMLPYAKRFEGSAKQAEEAARDLNQTMFSVAELLADPTLRATADIENLGQLRALPAWLAEKLGDYNQLRPQLTAAANLSRDMRAPTSAFKRGFDSLDAIMQLIRDWIAAFDGLEDDRPDDDQR